MQSDPRQAEHRKPVLHGGPGASQDLIEFGVGAQTRGSQSLRDFRSRQTGDLADQLDPINERRLRAARVLDDHLGERALLERVQRRDRISQQHVLHYVLD